MTTVDDATSAIEWKDDGTAIFDPSLEYGSSGLRAFSGYVLEEFLPILRGRQGARTYREMEDNEPVIGAMLFAIAQMIRACEWTVQPSDDVKATESEKAQEYAESIMEDMSHTWGDFISEALTMLPYGYAPMEIVYKIRGGENPDDPTTDSKFDDGHIGVRKIALRGQDTVLHWIMDANNNVKGVVQQPWTGPTAAIPLEKLLLFRTTSRKDNPEGRSILRNAYRPYYFKKRIEEIEAIGVERGLAGFPVLKIPSSLIKLADNPNGGQEAKLAKQAVAMYKKIVTNIRMDEQSGVVLPSDMDEHGHAKYDLSLLTTATKASFDTSAIIDQKSQQMATTVLADFIFLGHGSRGSQALSVDKTSMFFSAIQGYLDQIADVINRHLLPRLWRLNGFDMASMPKFVPTMARRFDLAELGTFLLNCAQAGMSLFPDDNLENFVRNTAGLPEKTPDDLLDGAGSATVGGGGQDITALAQAVQRRINEMNGTTIAAPKTPATVPPSATGPVVEDGTTKPNTQEDSGGKV